MTFHTLSDIYEVFLKHPNICTDTRKITPNCLFMALKGQNFNGNTFAHQALEAGAAYAIVDEQPSVHDDRFLYVEDVLTFLQQLATHHRLQSKAQILAITGTNGKTTTKELVAQVLKTQYNIIYTQGNLNNHIGVPLTLLTIQADTDIAIIEMGANHQGEIKAYCDWAQPDLGLITNIGKAHLEGFGGLEGVKKAKGELYNYLSQHNRTIFRYADDPNLTEIGAQLKNTITYGWNNAHIIGINKIDQPYAQVDVSQPEDLKGSYPSQLIGSYNAPNILCAIAVGHHFHIDPEKIMQAISTYTPVNARSQLVQQGSNTIILDAYNANPTSMKAAIDNFYHQNFERKVICIGGMKELGDESHDEHIKIVDLIKSYGFHEVYLVGEEFKNLEHSFKYFDTSDALKDYLHQHPISSSHILIKGSRGSKMEVILEAI